MVELKKVYAAVDEQTALYELDLFEEKWERNTPRSHFLGVPTGRIDHPISSIHRRCVRLIYTTNPIENFNRQLRKVTKAKSVFPTDESLLKMLYQL